jgi:hypothetical protein
MGSLPKGQSLRVPVPSEPLKEAKPITDLPENGHKPRGNASLSPSEDAQPVPQLPQGQPSHGNASSPQASSAEANSKMPHQSGQVKIASALEDLCDMLDDAQNDRQCAIRMQNRINGTTLAYIRSKLGYHTGLPKAERERLSRRARAIKSALEKGEEPKGEPDAFNRFAPWVVAGQEARKPYDELRQLAEKQIEKLAKELPAQDFAKNVPGFSLKALGVIAAEAGDLSRYPKKGHLWKRLGLAVIDGKRQGSVPQGLSPEARSEAWKKRGYNPSRRSEIFTFIDDTGVFRAQGPDSKYRQYYEKKKAEYLERGWGKKHADDSARRVMAKKVIEHLWQAWRKDVAGVK